MALQHGRQIVPVIFCRNSDNVRAQQFRHNGINGKTKFRDKTSVPGPIKAWPRNSIMSLEPFPRTRLTGSTSSLAASFRLK